MNERTITREQWDKEYADFKANLSERDGIAIDVATAAIFELFNRHLFGKRK